MDPVIRGDDPDISAADYVLCNGDIWPQLTRKDLLAELRTLAGKVLAEAKGVEP